MVTLGSGFAMALTGQAAEIGMTVGRLVGCTCLPYENTRRQLILSAAGAGMAANFDTPLSAVFFALEISKFIIKDEVISDTVVANDLKGFTANIQRRDILSLFLAIAGSCVVARKGGLAASGHFLRNNIYRVGQSYPELGLFCLLGASSAILIAVFEMVRDSLKKVFSVVTKKYRPILGSVLCSIGLLLGKQQSFISGFAVAAKIASGDVMYSNPFALFAFIIERILFLSISSVSGFVGGPFATAMYTGTALGSLFRMFITSCNKYLSATFVSSLFPIFSITSASLSLSCSSTYAVVGLASTVAACFK